VWWCTPDAQHVVALLDDVEDAGVQLGERGGAVKVDLDHLEEARLGRVVCVAFRPFACWP